MSECARNVPLRVCVKRLWRGARIRSIWWWFVIILFLFYHWNIYCDMSLESPKRGGSNEMPQYVFQWKQEKKLCLKLLTNTPCPSPCCKNKPYYYIVCLVQWAFSVYIWKYSICTDVVQVSFICQISAKKE